MEDLQSQILSGREITHASPKAIVILLHGVGANGDDLISLVPQFQHLIGGEVAYLSPNGAFDYDMAPFPGAYQWFSLGGYNPAERNFDSYLDFWAEGVQAIQKILGDFISEQCKRFSLGAENVVLVGFSQGAMISFYGAMAQIPIQGGRLGGIVGYAGALFGSENFADQDGSALPPILILHGQEDEAVPLYAAEHTHKFFQSIGADVTLRSYPGLAHSIGEQSVIDGAEFIKEKLALS